MIWSDHEMKLIGIENSEDRDVVVNLSPVAFGLIMK